MQRARWRALRVLLASLPLAGCGEPLSNAECERLLEHYVELLVRSDRPETAGVELERMKREARARAARNPDFLSCSREVPRRKFECAMSSTSADDLERCML